MYHIILKVYIHIINLFLIKKKSTLIYYVEEYIRKIDDEYSYEEVPVEEYYENGI
jgi:hypothetical protein